MSLSIASSAFSHNGAIPSQYTCDGPDHVPPLSWSGAPGGTKSLALIMDDPDAPDPAKPQRVYVHWVVYDIPAATTGIPEGGRLPAGARVGKNDWGKAKYGGPCPPIGRHRYFFKLFALDASLGALADATKAGLERAMKDHVLEKAEMIGTYERKRDGVN
jgi:Raf kinase inhibitor-like YbhB/YbcL family protein